MGVPTTPETAAASGSGAAAALMAPAKEAMALEAALARAEGEAVLRGGKACKLPIPSYRPGTVDRPLPRTMLYSRANTKDTCHPAI
jgi:hypothetical protein